MRKITAIVLSLVLLFALSVSASAAALTFLHKEYDAGSDSIYCYGNPLPAGGKLTVSAGSRVLENVSLSTLEKEHIPVTVYCLVECATSLSDKTRQQQQDVLLTFSSLMQEGDSMVLATLDGTLTESKPMFDKEIRDTAIETMSKGQVHHTNLYDGISQALVPLTTSTTYETNRVLVILCEGYDDGLSKVKPEELPQQIQDSGIPVYTVVLSPFGIQDRDLAHLQSFADASMGGFLTYPDREGIAPSVAARQVWDSIKGVSAIRIGAEELQGTDADQQLLIRYDVADTRYEDTILIRAVDVPEVVPTGEAPTETTGEDEEGSFFEDLPLPLLIGGGAAILVVLFLIVFLALRKKPEPLPEPEPVNPIMSEYDPKDENLFSADSFPGTTPFEGGDSIGSTTPVFEGNSFDGGYAPTAPVTGSFHVHAVAIMHPEVSADFYLIPNVETTFGRTEKAAVVLNSGDKKLSSCHGCLFWDGKMLLVQDRNSTNGTAVNGEICPPNVWLRLENGATLSAGQYEYRISFDET